MRTLLKKRGQVWVETVIYTVIGLAIIGIVLSIAKPKIDAKKDEIIIEQAIETLRNIDDKIYDVQSAVGNRRSLDLKIGKGKMIIDSDNDTISWIIDSSFEYSEEGVVVPVGNLNVTTTREGGWKVRLDRKYNVEISYNGAFVGKKEIDAAPTPYRLQIENNATTTEGIPIIVLREV